MAANKLLLDGKYTLGFYVGRPVISYPFAVNGDYSSILIIREWRQSAAAYFPGKRGVDRDPKYTQAYLILESDTEPTGFGDVIRTLRTFAIVPSQQTVPSSLFITKPDIPGTFPQAFGDYRIFQPVSTSAAFDAYAAQTVTADTGAPSFYPTGGTYTLTFGGNTTGSLNYNDNAATVQTALNALTSVSNRGNVAVSGSYNTSAGFAITFNSYAQITIDSTLLTGGTIVEAESLTSGGYNQLVGASISPTASDITVTSSLTYVGQGADGEYKSGALNPTNTERSVVVFGYSGNFPYAYSRVAPTGGTYTLTISGQTTSALAYNASFSDITTALNALGVGVFLVTGSGSAPLIPSGVNQGIYFNVMWLQSAPTGGTFTLTAFTQTTGAIAYNASTSTVQTALNALTNITNRGGVTVTGDLRAGFAIAFANAVFTASASSLTPAASTISPSITDGAIGRTQQIIFASSAAYRDITIPNHGIAQGDTIYILAAGSYYGDIMTFIVPSASVVRLLISAADSYASVGTITEAGKRTAAGYTPGTALTRINRVTNFYLPGVTSGITTAADIPLPLYQGDPTPLLTAIFSQSTSINYQIGELEQWRESPILARTITTINATQL